MINTFEQSTTETQEKSKELIVAVKDEIEAEFKQSGGKMKWGDKESMKKVLERLPEDLIGHMSAYYKEVLQEDTINAIRKGIPENERRRSGLREVVAGHLFEELTRAEYQSVPEALAGEILDIMHSPGKHKFMQGVGFPNNPDLDYIKMDEETNTVWILAAGECKLGKLDSRACTQLLKFRAGFEKVAGAVNDGEISEDDNTPELVAMKASGKRLEVSEEFKQILYIPRQRAKISPHALFKEGLDDGTYGELAELFTGKPPKVEIIESKFDVDLVWKLADKICEEIEESQS